MEARDEMVASPFPHTGDSQAFGPMGTRSASRCFGPCESRDTGGKDCGMQSPLSRLVTASVHASLGERQKLLKKCRSTPRETSQESSRRAQSATRDTGSTFLPSAGGKQLRLAKSLASNPTLSRRGHMATNIRVTHLQPGISGRGRKRQSIIESGKLAMWVPRSLQKPDRLVVSHAFPLVPPHTCFYSFRLIE